MKNITATLSCCRSFSALRKLLLVLPAIALALTGNVHAAIYTWDISHAGTAGSDGPGTWDNATANFTSAGADTTFTSAATTDIATPLALSGTGVVSGNATFTVTSTTGLAVGQYVSLTQFPVGSFITGFTGTTVTMSSNATGNLGSGTVKVMNGNAVTFGSNSGAAGTVTVSGTQNAAYMTINNAGSGNYTFTGGTISLLNGTDSANGAANLFVNATGTTTINSSINGKIITFGNAGTSSATLKLGGGSSALFGGAIAGTTVTNSQNATLELTTGNYAGSTASINIGNSASATGGLLIDAGATWNISNSGTVQIGSANSGLVTVNGGTILDASGSGALGIGRNANSTGHLILNSGTITNSATTPTIISFVAGTGILDVNGGALTLNGTATASGILAINAPGNGAVGQVGAGGTATANLNGGTTKVNGIIFGGNAPTLSILASNGTGTLNVNSGSTLYIGTGGIVNNGSSTGTYHASIDFAGGTVGASGDWSTTLPSALTTTTYTNTTTFQAADSGGVSHNITLTGASTGTGGISKTGGGILTLNNANLSGASSVNAGKLIAGNTTVGALTLNASAGGTNITPGDGVTSPDTGGANTVLTANGMTWNASGGSSSLTFVLGTTTTNSTTLNLGTGAFTKGSLGTFTINLSGGDSTIANQTNGATYNLVDFGTSAGTTFLVSDFTPVYTPPSGTFGYFAINSIGGGQSALQFVLIPEPSTWALMIGGMAFLLVIQRRRSRVC